MLLRALVNAPGCIDGRPSHPAHLSKFTVFSRGRPPIVRELLPAELRQQCGRPN